MLTSALLFGATLAAGGFSLVAAISAASMEIALLFVPPIFIVSLIIGLGARNWGRCL
jgi:hypothetical protein